jgi:hypothetical protein
MARFLTFIETEVFTRRMAKWEDDTYAELQVELARDPSKGRVIPGTGGLRKIRMAARGKGKRGGARIVYYFVPIDETIYMIFAYDKGEAEDLTAEQKKTLKALAQAMAGQHRRSRP